MSPHFDFIVFMTFYQYQPCITQTVITDKIYKFLQINGKQK